MYIPLSIYRGTHALKLVYYIIINFITFVNRTTNACTVYTTTRSLGISTYCFHVIKLFITIIIIINIVVVIIG